MYKAIHRSDPNGAWIGFNGVLENGEWHKITEYDVIRLLHLFNKQYYFEPNPEYLSRVQYVINSCEKRNLKFSTIWAFNELIRLHLSGGRRDLAYWIKRNIETRVYGSSVALNVHTYAALFSEPSITTLADLVRLTTLYDEMIHRGIKPSVQIQKTLINAARRVGEYRLLEALLKSTKIEDVPYSDGIKAARFVNARSKGYIALRQLSPALAEAHMLLASYQIPKGRHSSLHHLWKDPKAAGPSPSSSRSVHVPLESEHTQQSFFFYLRSTYEGLIYMCVRRRKGKKAWDLLEDLRRNCLIPPTLNIYTLLVKYYAKRKDIARLREIHELMRQDGVSINEHIYTKFITSCMFTPKKQLLDVLTKRVAVSTVAENDQQQLSSSTPKEDGEEGKTTADASERAKEEANVDELVYHPNQCIQFFEDMLDDLNVRPNDIRNQNLHPNVHITNSIMRAYLMLGKPVQAYREFCRYYLHQRMLHSSGSPLDVSKSQRTVMYVFAMAQRATTLLGDKRAGQRIYVNMLEWGLNPSSSPLLSPRR